MSRSSRILQRLPIISHAAVLVLAIAGRTHAPYLLALVFFLIHVVFVVGQVRMAYGMISCWRNARTHWKTDWWAFYSDGIKQAPASALETVHTPTTLPHIIVVPSYKEDLATLRQTLSILASHPISRHVYKVCLAMEQRETGAMEKGTVLVAEFSERFLDIAITLHPSDLPDEVPGKGSNTRWATRWMVERELALSSNPDSTIPDAVVTIMDADTAFAADYFLAVAVRYLLATPEIRKNMMFVPPIIFDRNHQDVPAITRTTDIMWATAGIGGIYPSSSVKIPTSAYSMSMSLVTHVGFWDAGPGAIGEDMHMFCKAMFDTKGHLHVETIHSPASQCNVIGGVSRSDANFLSVFWSDCHARWAQAVRHMWGSLDTGYVFNRVLTRDFGVSAEREIQHKLHRVEMRRIISESTQGDSHSYNPYNVSEALYDSSPKINHGNVNTMHSKARWMTSNLPTMEEEMETSSTTSSSSTLADPLSNTEEPSSSAYSYSSVDEEQEPLYRRSTAESKSRTFRARNVRLRAKPIIYLVARLYEAHLMLVHISILLFTLVILPKLARKLEEYVTTQSLVWGRSTSPVISMAEPKPLEWSFKRDGIVATSVDISQRIGLIGAIAAMTIFVFHDLYHRDVSQRWKTEKNETRMRNQGSSLRPSQLESGDGIQPSFDQFDLGIAPYPHQARRMPWSFLDFLAVPGAFLFGGPPLLYAQICHIWTDRLAYKVSAKPDIGRVQ